MTPIKKWINQVRINISLSCKCTKIVYFVYTVSVTVTVTTRAIKAQLNIWGFLLAGNNVATLNETNSHTQKHNYMTKNNCC